MREMRGSISCEETRDNTHCPTDLGSPFKTVFSVWVEEEFGVGGLSRGTGFDAVYVGGGDGRAHLSVDCDGVSCRI